jgi:hypothetical protein
LPRSAARSSSGPAGPASRGLEQVAELDALIAAHAGDRGFAGEIGIGEILHHRLAEAALVIEHVMGDADAIGDAAGVVDVLPGAAGALAACGGAVVIELQRHADDVVAFIGEQRRRH